jgi:hypothetical protein
MTTCSRCAAGWTKRQFLGACICPDCPAWCECACPHRVLEIQHSELTRPFLVEVHAKTLCVWVEAQSDDEAYLLAQERFEREYELDRVDIIDTSTPQKLHDALVSIWVVDQGGELARDAEVAEDRWGEGTEIEVD